MIDRDNVLPNFFLIGAAKSGTTSICNYLSSHPDVFICNPKEPRYFCHKEFKPIYYYKQTLTEHIKNYKLLFSNGRDCSARGDGSVHYLYFHDTAKNIHEVIPNAKIIAILRNPIDRAYSHYLMDKGTNFIKGPFSDVLDNKHNSEYFRLRYTQYISLGLYYKQLSRYFDIFPKQSIRIYLYEDLSDTRTMITDILSFLNVRIDMPIYTDTISRPYKTPRNNIVSSIYKVYFMNYHIRMAIKRILPKQFVTFINHNFFDFSKPKLTKEMRLRLLDIFYPDIQKTQTLISRDLSHWCQ